MHPPPVVLLILLTFRFIRRYLFIDIEQMYFPVYHRFVHMVAQLPRVTPNRYFVGDFAGMLAHVFRHFFNGHSSFKFHRYFCWLLFC